MNMNDHTQCPACRSLSTHVTKGEFKASGFQAFGNRVCDHCGTAWRPRCSHWAAIGSIVAGFFVLGGVLATVVFLGPATLSNAKDVEGVVGFCLLVVMGLWAFFYGIAVLFGRAGKMRILGKVLSAQAEGEPSEPGSRSADEGVCRACHRQIPPGSTYFLHCGVRQAG
jgi:hypothetical protein